MFDEMLSVDYIKKIEKGIEYPFGVITALDNNKVFTIKVFMCFGLRLEIKLIRNYKGACDKTVVKMQKATAEAVATAIETFLLPYKLSLLPRNETDTCYVCFNDCKTLTKCKHPLCQECALKQIKCNIHNCGVCRKLLINKIKISGSAKLQEEMRPYYPSDKYIYYQMEKEIQRGH